MIPFRALYVLAAGIGCACGVTLDEKRRNFFKVNAYLIRAPTNSYQNPKRVQALTYYGIPKRDTLLIYDDFQVSFDGRSRVPNWVLEHLTYKKLVIKSPDTRLTKGIMFHEDEDEMTIPKKFQPKITDYVKSGFLMGHLASEYNHKHSLCSVKDTFKLTTVAPLKADFFYSILNDLESYIIYLTYYYKGIYVFTGPLYLPKDGNQVKYQVIGENNVSAPTHIFKIVIAVRAEGGVEMGCYIVPTNVAERHHPLSEYRVMLPELESKAGFLLFEDPEAYTHFEHLSDKPDFRCKVQDYLADVGLSHLS